MKTILTLAAFTAVLLLALLGFIYSGIYDVAADSPDAGLIAWALETTQHRSVHRRAEAAEEELRLPPLDDQARVRSGLVLYHEQCLVCHGAPGVPIADIGQGLNPTPPELSGEAEEPAEVFWVVKHGIKMTGMPAWGASHGDDVLWSVVAFLQKLPELDAKQYRELVSRAPADREMKPGANDRRGEDAHSGMHK